MIQTLLVDTARLGAVFVQEPPRLVESKDGKPSRDDATGQPVYLGRIVLPGGVRSAFQDLPMGAAVRLRSLGSDGGIVPGVSRLDGKVTISRWFHGVDRRTNTDLNSDITISAERVIPAPGEPLALDGWLPVGWHHPARVDPSARPTVLSSRPQRDNGYLIELALPPGAMEPTVHVASDDPLLHLLGRPVNVTLWAKLIVPEREDLSRFAKAELAIIGTDWAAADEPARRNGRTPVEPAAEPVG